MIHGSLTPNSVSVGETLTVAFDGSDDADDVVVTLLEVDAGSDIEPRGGSEMVARFSGKLAGDALSLIPRGGKPNPELGTAPATAPKLKVAIGDKTFDVGLPGEGRENGVFELIMEVTAAGKKSYRSPEPVFVRAFKHFQAEGVPRPVVAFITGKDSKENPFFTNATKFWRLAADVVVVRPGMTLQEIAAFLKTHKTDYGDWGQVNIVAHGRARQIELSPVRGLAPPLNRQTLREAIEERGADFSPDGLDGTSEVVFRACNIGQHVPLLEALRSDVFAGAGSVRAPKIIQGYSPDPAELFYESLTFDVPGRASPVGAALEAGLNRAFEALPAPRGKWEQERPTFSEDHDWTQDFSLTVKVFEQALWIDLESAAPREKDEALLVEYCKEVWRDKHFDQKDSTWSTPPDRWAISVRSKKEVRNEEGGIWCEVIAGTGTPKIQALTAGSSMLIGSSDDADVTIVATGVEPEHAHVTLLDNQVEFRAASGKQITVDHRRVGDSSSLTAPLPCTLHIGRAAVRFRHVRMFEVSFEAARRWVDRRRELRVADPSKPHKERKRATEVDIPDLYGDAR